VWSAAADAFVYWADSNTGAIGRANLDGSGVDQRFIAGLGAPWAVAVDNRHIYWSNTSTGAIGRANLDGSGANPSFIAGVGYPRAVAVDDLHLYWADLGSNAIGRANLDGSSVDRSFITGANAPTGVAVDGRRVYWTNLSGRSIGRADLDGSAVDQSFMTDVGNPWAVAVDGGHVYWANTHPGLDSIGRANLDGSGADPRFVGSAQTDSFALAVDDDHLYWPNAYGSVGRADLDGSSADQSFITGASGPTGVAVDAGPEGTATPSTTSMAFGTQPLTTLGAPRSLTISNTGHGLLEIDTVQIAAGDVDDFLVSHDGCSHRTLAVGASCTVGVRFGPSGEGARRSMLELRGNDPAGRLRIGLEGSGGTLPQGPPGRSGDPGPAGATGAQAPPAPRGLSQVRVCRNVKVRGANRRRCQNRAIGTTLTISGTARASLTRHGLLYATGTAQSAGLVLQARRRVPAGRYTLTLRYRGNAAPATTHTAITIR
jgi:streptogramin lyase